MSLRKDGYVIDINYTSGYYKELSPVYINFSLLANHIDAPDIDGEFNYCELGCGNAISLLVMASNYPNGKFYGIDFNPSHIKYGKYMAKKANLNNIEFFNMSFADALEKSDKFPNFDYIVFHGVFSWVGKNIRNDMVKFCNEKINNGGVIYNSYNALPGCNYRSEIQKLLIETSHTIWGRTDERIKQSINIIEEFLADDSMKNQKSLAQTFAPIKSQNTNYLSHEYLNMDWEALYFIEVEKIFTQNAFSFASLCDPVEKFSSFMLPKSTNNFLNNKFGDKHTPIKEHYKDYILNRSFRKDLYIRGTKTHNQYQVTKALKKYKFIFNSSHTKVEKEIRHQFFNISFDQNTLDKYNSLLSEGAYFNDFIIDDNVQNAIFYLSVLLSKQIIETTYHNENTYKITSMYNKAICEENTTSNEITQLAAPKYKTTITIDLLYRLIYLAYINKHKGKKMVDYIENFITKEVKMSLTFDEDLDLRGYIEKRCDVWEKEQKDIWIKLGVIEE